MSVPGFTSEDLAAPPRWRLSPAGEAFVAKGNFVTIVLQEAHDGNVYLFSQGELIAVRHGKEAAVHLAEKLVAQWYPGDPPVTKPDEAPVVGSKTADGKKYITDNPYGAPI